MEIIFFRILWENRSLFRISYLFIDTSKKKNFDTNIFLKDFFWMNFFFFFFLNLNVLSLWILWIKSIFFWIGFFFFLKIFFQKNLYITLSNLIFKIYLQFKFSIPRYIFFGINFTIDDWNWKNDLKFFFRYFWNLFKILNFFIFNHLVNQKQSKFLVDSKRLIWWKNYLWRISYREIANLIFFFISIFLQIS